MKTNAQKLGLLAFLVLLFNCKQEQFPSIYLNQIGFTPKAVKQAFVSGDVNTNEFNLLNPVSNEIVYEDVLTFIANSNTSSNINKSKNSIILLYNFDAIIGFNFRKKYI